MTNSSSGSCPSSFLCGKGTYYISIVVLVLFVLNCAIIGMNRSTQNDIANMQTQLADKGTKIQQSQVFANIFQGIVQAMGAAAVNKKDEQMKTLLTENGLQIKPVDPNAKPGTAPAGAAPAAQ